MSVILDFDPASHELVLHTGPLDTDLAKQIGGLRFKGEYTWRGIAARSTAITARALFGEELQLTETASRWAAYELAMDQWAEAMKSWDPGDSVPWAAGLRPLQRTGVAWLVANQRAALFDDPGAGKGVMTSVAFSLLGPDEFPALIVAPRSLKWNHARELERWAPEVKPFVVSGTAPARKKTIDAALAHEGKAVLVMNWEQLLAHSMLAPYGSTERTDKEKEPKELNEAGIRTVLLDEAHRTQGPTNKQTRAAWAVAHGANRVWETTATPIPNVIGFWSIMHTLVPWEVPTRTKYQDRYTLSTKIRAKGGREIDKPTDFNPRTLPELNRILDRYILRREIDVIAPELPPVVYKTMWVEMEAKQRTAYEQMRKKKIAEIGDDLLVAADPMLQAGRLLIMASALPVLDEEGNIVELSEPSSKVQAVLDWLEDNPDRSLVVFAQSRKLIELVSRVLQKPKTKTPHVLITGAQNEAQRDVAVQQFQSGEARVILGTYGAMSEGLTLTRADTQMMLQRSFELKQNVQADGRTRRIGQESDHVTIIDVVSVKSYDESVFLSGAYKEEAAQAFLKDPSWVKRELEERV